MASRVPTPRIAHVLALQVINVYEKFPRRTPIPEGNGHSQYLRMTASKVWAEVKALKIARNSSKAPLPDALLMPAG